jgi:imidazolonepropionase-like amidohydrolase
MNNLRPNILSIKKLTFLGFLLAITPLYAQQVKKAEKAAILLRNATLHTVSRGTVSGDLLIRDGLIADIGTNLAIHSGTAVLDCSGKHVYPGFIDGGSKVGLAEIGSISVTNDFSELGDFIPHMKALTAVNPNSVSIPVTRVNGVTTVFAKPEGSTFPGTGALIDLFGYTPDQMSCGSERVVMQFPSTGRRGRWDRRSDEDIKKETEKALKNIDQVYESAIQYARIDSAAKADRQSWTTNNPQMEALLPVIRGQQPLFVEANSYTDITALLDWISNKKIKVVLTGASEGWRVADRIARAGIPVITGPVLSVPRRENDRYDAMYTNAGKMAGAGVKVAIRTDESENTRNLPFNAGFAAAYGMGTDEALRAITLTPAEIFGVQERYGSLDKGKVANLFVATGDPFEMKTRIEKLFIRGWDIPLESRHTLLYDEFLERTPGNQKK